MRVGTLMLAFIAVSSASAIVCDSSCSMNEWMDEGIELEETWKLKKNQILNNTKEYCIIVCDPTSKLSARAMPDVKRCCSVCEQVSRLDRGVWRIAEI